LSTLISDIKRLLGKLSKETVCIVLVMARRLDKILIGLPEDGLKALTTSKDG